MNNKALQAVRGMPDLLPAVTGNWQVIETILRVLVEQYGYFEIRFPIVEQTQLFARSIGEVTDIVEKEMYTFTDRNGDSLSLRPEGTAGCVRACLQHNLLEQTQRLWYMGPMYRHERPQKGRYRQFHQFGLEAFGLSGPEIEVELILFGERLWTELELSDQMTLKINSLGTQAERAHYRQILVQYLEDNSDQLDADSQRRLQQNPLRILDSKNPDMAKLIAGAPKLREHLGVESQAHFNKFCELLTALDIAYEIDPCLVRGLDYYSHTVFEWVTDQLGAQSTVCAGGRYDDLIPQLGGRPLPATGFALGLERLILLYEQHNAACEQLADVYLIADETAVLASFRLAESLRNCLPLLSIVQNQGGGSFKSQFKKADRSGAQLGLVLGSDELAANTVSIKFLREDKNQETIPLDDLPNFLRVYFEI